MSKQTLGQYRVGVSFNPSQNPLVDEIKQKAAELIDLIYSIPYPVASAHQGLAVLEAKSNAAGRVEEAAMWAVKAATKPVPEGEIE